MRFEPSRVEALLFDLDGTLADSDDEFIVRAARWLEPWAPRLGLKDGRRIIRTGLQRLEGPKNNLYAWMDWLHLDEVLAPLTEGFHRWRARRPRPQNMLIPGVLEMLSKVNSRYPLAIVTARGHRNTLNYLEANGLKAYFSVVATARTQRRSKPHPAPVQWAASQLGYPPSSCVMVGDTTLDILSGKRAGAQTVGVLSGFGLEDDLEHSGADAILGSCAELPAILDL
jgi:phosphoglycolate phosphatase